jgi:DNA-binding ferritin-like protein
MRRVLDELGEVLDGYSARISERASALGVDEETGEVARDRRYLHDPFAAAEATDHEVEIELLAAELAALGDASRSAIAAAAAAGDIATRDVFTGLSREIDYDLWQLESLSRPSCAPRYRPKRRLSARMIGGKAA